MTADIIQQFSDYDLMDESEKKTGLSFPACRGMQSAGKENGQEQIYESGEFLFFSDEMRKYNQ